MAKKKTTTEFAQELLTRHNLRLTSEYTGAHNAVTFLCGNNHESSASASNVLARGFNCPHCGKGKRKTRESLAKELLDKYNIVLVSEYKSMRDYITYTCANGHSVTALATNVLHKGPYCAECAGQHYNQLTTEEVYNRILSKFNMKLISEYTGRSDSITVKCQRGHESTYVAGSLLQKTHHECLECKQEDSGWTESRVQELKNLIDQNISLESIAQHFDKTVTAIKVACSRFKISRRPDSDIRYRLEDILSAQDRALITQGAIQVKDTIIVKCCNNHIVEQSAANVLYKDSNCPKCSAQQSKLEKYILDFIRDHYSGWIEERDRTVLDGKELDIVLPDLGLAFEINGVYWHTEEYGKDKYYHVNKTLEAKEQGYKLIHIWDYDNLEIVESRILQLLGHSKRIMARKCELNMVDWHTAKAFLSNSHLQGAGSPTKLNYGLYYENELVAIMTFQKPRFSKEADYEMIRYATKLNTTVVGGASKLLKYFLNTNNNPTILTYANQDWSSGSLYQTLGFKYQHTSEPNYKYVKGSQLLTRYQCQKHKLPKLLGELFDPKLTETQNMEANGFQKLWDTGNLVYLLK